MLLLRLAVLPLWAAVAATAEGCPAAPTGYTLYPSHCVGGPGVMCSGELRTGHGCSSNAQCVARAVAACAGSDCRAIAIEAGGPRCDSGVKLRWHTFRGGNASLVPNMNWTAYTKSGATPPPPAPPPAPAPYHPCTTATNCNLNGDCVHNRCVCDPAWSAAPDCSVLSFRKVAHKAGQAPGYYNATQASWGGNVVRGGDGNYHLIHAQFANHCGIYSRPGGWQNNSFVGRSVSITGKSEGS
jgi:hypothetical protein